MVKYTIEQKISFLNEHEQSGLSASEFARENNINIKTFGNWKRLFKDSSIGISENKSTHPISNTTNKMRSKSFQLHPLSITDEPLNSQSTVIDNNFTSVTVTFPNGVIVDLCNTPISQISQLINNYHQCSR